MTTFALILFSFAPSVSAQPTCEECGDKSIAELITKLEEEDGTQTNLNPDESVTEKMNTIVSDMEIEFSEILTNVEQKGFLKDEQVSNYITFENLKDDEKIYENVGLITEFYIKDQKELVQKQVWVDLKNDEVIRYNLNEIHAETESFENLVTYDIKADQSQEEGLQPYGFKFNGVSFACSISGIIACTAATGGLAVYYPWVGGVASVACASAFAVGCAFT